MQLPEILFIDKPAGLTSFDVIRQLRRRTAVRKFGHAGTLDPMATGLMIIGVEQGTKQLKEYIKLDKVYDAQVLIGESYTTGDVTGQVLEKVLIDTLSEDALKEALFSLRGIHRLPVSAYSAIKKDGKKMYERAREAAKIGDIIRDVPYRDMEVYEVQWKQAWQQEGKVFVHASFHVASGVYIRSLAEELGRRVGYPATLAALRRTHIGPYSLKDAKQLTDF